MQVNPTLQLSAAETDVLAERRRQVSKEGYSTRHDDEHDDGAMAVAAAYYALHGARGKGQVIWPWDLEDCKPRDKRSNLVRAAALAIAEIERLDRAQSKIRPDGFPTWICKQCETPNLCVSIQGCDREEINR